MKEYFVKLLQIILISGYSIGVLYGQSTQSQLEANRKKIFQEIQQSERELKLLQDTRGTTISKLNQIKSRIDRRRQMIIQIDSAMSYTIYAIDTSKVLLASLDQKIHELNQQYQKVIRYHYIQLVTKPSWNILLNAHDMNQAFLRWQYRKKIAAFCKSSLDELQYLRKHRLHGIQNLTSFQSSQLELRELREKQLTTLQKDEEDQKAVIQKLSLDEKKLYSRIESFNKKLDKVNRLIEQEAFRIANKKKEGIVSVKASKIKTRSKELNNSSKNNNSLVSKEEDFPEINLLDEKFSLLKGKLGWPISKGALVCRFGIQPHPIYPAQKMLSNGIDIKTALNIQVKAVASGTVSYVDMNNFKLIMINHGTYLTVYVNVKNSKVQIGQEVQAGDILGLVNDESAYGFPTLHFEIWKGGEVQNPLQWLAPR